MMSQAENVVQSGHFYGVYLLCSENPEKRYQGKCYIGFTVNPNRRIQQHNRGLDFGGAKKTNNKGPWRMVMIVHGFPNNISALQFEWAWQQPGLSTRLSAYPDLKRKKPKENYVQYNFRILNRMLMAGPWNRLPLTVQWLEPRYECEFEYPLMPPLHMRIIKGSHLESLKKPKNSKKASPAVLAQQFSETAAYRCDLCLQMINNPLKSLLQCPNSSCTLAAHMTCLAGHFLKSSDDRGQYIPIEGECPICATKLKWVDLLQFKRLRGNPAQEENEGQLHVEEDDESWPDCMSEEENPDIEILSA